VELDFQELAADIGELSDIPETRVAEPATDYLMERATSIPFLVMSAIRESCSYETR
jgi:hypothetical protein